MQITNKTPYDDAEVRSLVLLGMAGAPVRRDVVVKYRTLPNDPREGFTPTDLTQPISLWVEPPSRYPQYGARSWQEELVLSAAHEAYHTRHPAAPHEVAAEHYAHKRYEQRGVREDVYRLRHSPDADVARRHRR